LENGIPSGQLASDLSDTVAVVAVVSGGSSGKEKAPDQAVSVLAVHGTRDPYVPVIGLSSGKLLNTMGVSAAAPLP
jgi:poly(3-hydroxybutyrate) depolymerase